MDYLLFFLIIIGAAFLLPELAKKIHLPYVTSIILAGIIIGPYGFKLFDLGDIASFLAFLGAIFLMFTAGLDVGLSSLRKIGKKAIIIALFNGIIPFATGYYIANYFGYNLITSLILGSIFVSSSIAIKSIFSSFTRNGRYVTIFPEDGIFNLYLGTSIVGNGIVFISPQCHFK